jgi:hypothetical protein
MLYFVAGAPGVDGGRPRLGGLALPEVDIRAGDLAGQVEAHQPRQGAGTPHQPHRVEVAGGDDALHGPGQPDVAGQGAGVDLVDAQDASRAQEVGQAAVGAPVAADAARLADDVARHVDALALEVLRVDAVVAHQGVGHGDDLAAVGGVGEDFLVAGHGGVEDDLAFSLSLAGEGSAREGPAIFECQKCPHVVFSNKSSQF